MPARIYIIYRIIIAIAIEVQTVDRFGVQVGGIVGRDESAPFGRVVSGVTVIEASVIRTILATRTKRGALAASASAYLFYHLPRPQSRKSLPDRNDLGGCVHN